MEDIVSVHEPTYWQPKEYVTELNKNKAKDFSWILKIRNDFGTFSVSGTAWEYFKKLGYSNLYASPNYVYNYLYYFNQLSYSWFQIVMNDGLPITLQIADRQIDTTGQFKNEAIGSLFVIRDIEAALILRDQKVLNFYANIPLSFTEQAHQEDLILESMLLFYQVLIKGTGNENEAQGAYNEIIKLLDWEEYKSTVITEGFNQEWVWQILFRTRKQLAESIFIPVLFIYHQILHQNLVGYEQAVHEALVKWREYYTMKYTDENGEERDHSTDPAGYLALPIAAACAYAFDKGLKLTNLQSDYIPAWLIEGHFDEFELLVKGDA